MSETCIVFGASSWLAKNFINKVRKRTNVKVIEVLRKATEQPLKDAVVGDPCDERFVSGLIGEQRPSQVVNFCGIALPDDQHTVMQRVNVNISASILKAISSHCLDSRLIAFGSAAEYGLCGEEKVSESMRCDPVSAYGKTKLSQTNLFLNDKDTAATANGHLVIRPFNLVGQGMPDSIIASTLWKKAQVAKDGEELDLFFPEMVRDFLTIEDATDGILELFKSSTQSALFNLCSGKGVTYKEFVELMLKGLGKKCRVIQSPHLVGEKPLLETVVGDSDKLQFETSWTIKTSLDSAFQHILDHER